MPPPAPCMPAHLVLAQASVSVQYNILSGRCGTASIPRPRRPYGATGILYYRYWYADPRPHVPDSQLPHADDVG